MLAWSPTLTVEVILIATLQMPPLPNSERGVLETKLPDGGPRGTRRLVSLTLLSRPWDNIRVVSGNTPARAGAYESKEC